MLAYFPKAEFVPFLCNSELIFSIRGFAAKLNNTIKKTHAATIRAAGVKESPIAATPVKTLIKVTPANPIIKPFTSIMEYFKILPVILFEVFDIVLDNCCFATVVFISLNISPFDSSYTCSCMFAVKLSLTLESSETFSVS